MTDGRGIPIYETMVELDVPAMVHVSSSCNPNFHATGAHYINADTTVFMQLIQGDLFHDFPDLALRDSPRWRGGALPLGSVPRTRRHAEQAAPRRARHEQRLLRHLRLPPARASTCCSRSSTRRTSCSAPRCSAPCAASTPTPGRYFDDTKRYIDAADARPTLNARGLRDQRTSGLPAPRCAAEGAGSMSTTFVPDADWLDWDHESDEAYRSCCPKEPSMRTATSSVPGGVFPFAPERRYTPSRRQQGAALRLA